MELTKGGCLDQIIATLIVTSILVLLHSLVIKTIYLMTET